MHAAHFVAMSALALGACGPRVHSNMDGLEFRVANASYVEVLDASHAALASEFSRINEDRRNGELTAGSNGCAYGPSDYVGIYITNNDLVDAAGRDADGNIRTTHGSETKFTFVKIVALDEGGRKGAETAKGLKERIEQNLSKSIH